MFLLRLLKSKVGLLLVELKLFHVDTQECECDYIFYVSSHFKRSPMTLQGLQSQLLSTPLTRSPSTLFFSFQDSLFPCLYSSSSDTPSSFSLRALSFFFFFPSSFIPDILLPQVFDRLIPSCFSSQSKCHPLRKPSKQASSHHAICFLQSIGLQVQLPAYLSQYFLTIYRRQTVNFRKVGFISLILHCILGVLKGCTLFLLSILLQKQSYIF